MTEKLDYKQIRLMIGHLNKAAGFIQFSGLEKSNEALGYVTGVINSLEDEVDRLIEEIFKKHE